jgi:uncharacterized protein YgfB (UPF0149 family)
MAVDNAVEKLAGFSRGETRRGEPAKKSAEIHVVLSGEICCGETSRSFKVDIAFGPPLHVLGERAGVRAVCN